jgi:hypothetical protein
MLAASSTSFLAHRQALDLHRQDLGGDLQRLLRRVRQPDASGLPPAAHQDLRFDHYPTAKFLGDGFCLGRRHGHPASGNRDPVLGEQLRCLD